MRASWKGAAFSRLTEGSGLLAVGRIELARHVLDARCQLAVHLREALLDVLGAEAERAAHLVLAPHLLRHVHDLVERVEEKLPQPVVFVDALRREELDQVADDRHALLQLVLLGSQRLIRTAIPVLCREVVAEGLHLVSDDLEHGQPRQHVPS